MPSFNARAAFTVNSQSVLNEDLDIVSTIIDDIISYIPWGGKIKWLSAHQAYSVLRISAPS